MLFIGIHILSTEEPSPWEPYISDSDRFFMIKELLDNFKAEVLEKFHAQEEKLDLMIAKQSETISKLEDSIAGQQKTIEEQNETIQMIATPPNLREDSGLTESWLIIINDKHRHRRNVTSHHSLSLLW